MTERSSLRDLFNPPVPKQIGGVDFSATRLGYESFEDALTVGPWVAQIEQGGQFLSHLQALKPGAPIGEALHRMLAHSLAVRPTPEAAPVQLTPDDVRDALTKHVKKFSEAQTAALVKKAAGVVRISEIKPKFFGAVVDAVNEALA